jgi:glycine cleavage system transcriptional repressor
MPMTSYVLISATGTDRVGIVDDLTEALLTFDCNIEESRMAVLGGEFAMIVLVSGSDKDIERLQSGVDAVGKRCGLDLVVKSTNEPVRDRKGRPYRLECVSLDTPGIVHSVTGLLRRRGINIDDLDTETRGAPFTGAPMFHMRITMIVPPSVKVGQLREELGDLASVQDLDITLRALAPGDPEGPG